jgi:hypothetical protein
MKINKPNQKVSKMAKETLQEELMKLRMQWYGHVIYMQK